MPLSDGHAGCAGWVEYEVFQVSAMALKKSTEYDIMQAIGVYLRPVLPSLVCNLAVCDKLHCSP